MIAIDIEPNFHYEGDERLLEKVFSNIISNAVSYSPERETVIVSLKDHVFLVENTGVHIGEDDLNQIFIPFYRIDKSHNRNTGGSGLGLYIVKTILERHKISYYMENIEDGVRFNIFFL